MMNRGDDGDITNALSTSTSAQVPTAGPAPLPIQNPYKVKKRNTCSRSPIVHTTDDENHLDTSTNALAETLPGASGKLSKVSVVPSTNNDANLPTDSNIQLKTTVISETASAAAAAGSTGNVAYWERLPSRTVSFGSAEILTVYECIQHASLYRDRQVRVTGLLHHRRFLPGNGPEDMIVQLELTDPVGIQPGKQHVKHISSKLNKRQPHQRLTSSLQRGSTGRPNTSSNSTRRLSTKLNRPSVSTDSTDRKVKVSSFSASLFSRKRSRPWFVTAKNTGTSSSADTGRKLSGAGKGIAQSKSDGMISVPKDAVLMVLVDPGMPKLEEARVGTMITVIGKVATVIENVAQEDEPLLDDALAQQSRDAHASRLHQIHAHSKSHSHFKVEARILQVLPRSGNDMTMFAAALYARRKTLFQRYHAAVYINRQEQRQHQSQPEQNHKQQPTIHSSKSGKSEIMQDIIQGCGPPPYDYFLADYV